MKASILLLLLAVYTTAHAQDHSQHNTISGYADSVNAGLITRDTVKTSPKRTAMATVAGTHIHIEYGSPGVRGRMIWGGLVAYNQVWATGAHKATTVDFSTDVTINEKKIKAGKYALFTIPGETTWTLIINSKFDQHLADEYNAAEDLVRVIVKPVKLKKQVQRLTYTVSPTRQQEAAIQISWDYLMVSLPIQLKPVQ